ncbi:MAG TPA: AAA family ATPase [Chloroflexia bacterium]|nr:AAA family ATPase [Chloroflexia bacterium]
MENVRSKRRPVPQQDDVDLAIEKMRHQIKYNPLRRYWWRYLLIFIITFGVLSFFAPSWNAGGPGAVTTQIIGIAIQLAVSLMTAIFFIYVQFFAIARPRAYWLKPYETGVSFNDYRGNPQVLEMAREVVMLLKGSKDFKNMGGEVIRGLLLEGDPGVGKSYLAQCIATEAGVPFGYCSAPSLQSPFLAGGMLSIRNLYKKARKLANEYGACILFMDEIDAIAQNRQGAGGQGFGGIGAAGMFGGGGSLLINELLVQMDPPNVDDRLTTKIVRWVGLDLRRKKAERPAVLTIGATNLIQQLDPALLRPGRFDRKITVDKPDSDGRREIIEYYLDKVNHENIPIDRMVAETIGYSPVEIKYVINEAVIRAHFNGRDVITYRDLIEARDLHEVGLRQPIRNMSREDKRRIAYHETGHAVAQALLVPWENIVKLTIIRHTDALGFMQPKPKEEKHVIFREELEVKIQVSLASRAAEELFLDSGSTGFSGDLDHATSLALLICAHTGLNDHLSSATVLGLTGAAYQIEVEQLLKDQMKKVKQLLQANSDMVHALAAELLEREELLGDEVMEVVNQFPVKLTSDAKTKRNSQFGFFREPLHPVNTGVWAEPEAQQVPLAATGTDDAVAHVGPTPVNATETTFRVVKDTPEMPAAPAAPKPASDKPAADPLGSFNGTVWSNGPFWTPPAQNTAPGVATPVTPSVPEVKQPVEPPQSRQQPKEDVKPAVVEPQPPAAPPADKKAQPEDDDLDDLLPKGW